MTVTIVSGLPGAGKSTIGRALAAQLGVSFLDKDDFLNDLLESSPDPRAERSALSRPGDSGQVAAACSATLRR